MGLRLKQYILLATLPLFLWLGYNNAANWHYHVNSQGAIVKHAHPYQPSKDTSSNCQEHSHSKAEFAILALLYTFAGLLTLFFLINAIKKECREKKISIKSQFFLKSLFTKEIQLRGPPLFQYITY
ncbi:hypothetical protein QA597_02690 [Marinilabiliaceae bacterium ANBcel2]|nr:hypothetical protein [Marinilabiliaceae bacterium ANBcel2]